MKYLSLASGSNGNCHCIQKKHTGILVDVGLSGKATENALAQHDIDLSGIQAILITHEHIDHIKGVGIVSRRYDIPIYATAKTWDAIGSSIGKIKPHHRLCLDKSSPLNIGDLQIIPFETSHDAADSCGFVIDDGHRRLAIATDLGCVTPIVEQAVLGSDVVILEANHDVEMLKVGSYPYQLKRRVLSDQGHLSNDAAGQFAARLVHSGTRSVLLAHLSGENNIPLLAYETVASELHHNQIVTGKDVRLCVLDRHYPSDKVDCSKL